MAPKSDRPPAATRAPARRARRAAQAIFVVFAAAFILDSTWQLGRQVFGYDSSSVPASPACSSALVAFEDAIDLGRAKAALERARERGEDAIARVADPALSAVERGCSAEGDREAVVVARRLRDAAVGEPSGSGVNLARLRRAVDLRVAR